MDVHTTHMVRARKMSKDLGSIPPRNTLMRELRIGAIRANLIREQLRSEDEMALVEATQDSIPDPTPTPDPIPEPEPSHIKSRVSIWPIYMLALPAAVAIWSGWVGLGELAGFGVVKPLPGISDFELNTAIALPIGVEAYAAYALRVWISGNVSHRTRIFARISVIASLIIGFMGQAAYHLMVADGYRSAPWQVVILVSGLPVVVLGVGSALAHLVSEDRRNQEALI